MQSGNTTNSFFKEPETDFKIEIAKEREFYALAPEFSVIIKQITYAVDIEQTEKNLKGKPDISFKCVDHNTLRISITPKLGNFAENDILFRNALSVPTRYRFTSSELQMVVNKYDDYLTQYRIKSKFSPKNEHSNTTADKTRHDLAR